MRLFVFATTCMLTLVGFVHGQAFYAFHQSCLFHPKIFDIRSAIDEAVRSAAVAKDRINDAEDQVTELLFNTIFKKQRSEEAMPANVFDLISQLQDTSAVPGSSATITMYCDNDRRFVLTPHPVLKKELWYNRSLRLTIPPGLTPSCHKPQTLAATYSTTKVKVTEITICDLGLGVKYATMAALAAIAKGGNLASPPGKGISNYNVLSRIMLHEFTHAWPARELGLIVDNGYHWKNIFPMPHEKAILNADSYAYFGQISLQTGLKLSEVPAERELGRLLRIEPTEPTEPAEPTEPTEPTEPEAQAKRSERSLATRRSSRGCNGIGARLANPKCLADMYKRALGAKVDG